MSVSRTLRTVVVTLAVAAATATGAVVTAPAATAATCAVTWGSLAKTSRADDRNARSGVSGPATMRATTGS